MMVGWDISADGYRLVVQDGAMRGLAYDEWPWQWGDPRYETTEDLGGGVITSDGTIATFAPGQAFSGLLRLRRTPGFTREPLPDGSPYAFIGLSDQLIWERCPCPWWHRLPFVSRRVHSDLP